MPNQGCKEGMEILGAWCFIVGAACYMLGDFIEFMMLGFTGATFGPSYELGDIQFPTTVV